ncbi:hypothetical protein cypCar_00024926, partial [Cyprinus carpio]
MMQRCESHESEVQRSPSLDSTESEFTRAARRGHRLAVGAFYGSRGSNVKDQAAQSNCAVVAVPPGGKPQDKRVSASGKYVVFYLDLSFVFLLEFEKLKMARGCLCCVKYMMFLFNLLFWEVCVSDYGSLSGCGLLGVGIWLSVSQGSFATFSPSFPSLSAANLVITLGSVIMVTGFLGCLGAIKENKCLLLS